MHIRDFKDKQVHFIGIGGISMSGLAEILLGRGYSVSGSDATESSLTKKLTSLGAKVFIGQKYGQHKGASLVIKTSAISKENEELRGVLEAQIPVMERIELLNQFMDGYKLSIGVSGMHGKTTCTSMLATILVGCGMNPTVHNGSELEILGGATHVGTDDVFVAEACEYKDNFLSLSPNVEIILNIDRDHLDYFKNLTHIISSYSKYISKLPVDGILIANGDDKNTLEASKARNCEMITFGLNSSNTYYASNIIDREDGCCDFDLYFDNKNYGSIVLNVPGRHNVYNALAAIVASIVCGTDIRCAKNQVSNYHGAKRRFEFIGRNKNNADIYHDYAHHPVEVIASLQSAKARAKKNVICIFQPHTYTRTKALLNEFSQSFDSADHVVIVDIYSAREVDKGEIHSRDLCSAIKKHGKVKSVCYLPSFEEAASYANTISRKGDMILTVGAGSIEQINDMLCR
ncbi:MAG: UDP-N-acetylmuramate--L-alanine ligase [Clostridiales bacterium]|nr:UDP-N-acetylmuramate--L-alanine ligase [Clostridiales bacterium]